MTSTYKSLVPAVEQASRVLWCLAQGNAKKMNLTEICNEVGIHKSKGLSILNTLQRFDLVQKDPETKMYRLGLGLLSLSRRVLDDLDYQSLTNPYLEDLALETNCTAVFAVINEENVFVVATHEGNQRIGVTIRLGHRFPLTWGAHGKAIVAFLAEEQRKRILAAEKLFFHGDETNLDRARLARELNECRTTGFAVDIGENKPGINAVASPVFGRQEKLLGCVFILGTFRTSSVKTYGEKVFNCAASISSDLGFHDSTKGGAHLKAGI